METIYVRPIEERGVRFYSFFRKIGPRRYELIPELKHYGFISKAKAEKRAREIQRQ